MIEILEQYGAPPKICSAIKRMYTDLTVRITLDGVSAEIPQTVGVRQGDNLSPVLFLFFMSAFAESLETEWEHQGLGKAEFVRTPAGEVGNDFGQLTSHPLIDSNCPTPYGEGWIFEILQLLYIDDGAFVFNNRADLERGAEVVNEHFKKFGMEMHVGRDEKKAKTEFMYVPTQNFFKDLPQELPAPSDPNCRQLAKKTTPKEVKTAVERREELKYRTHPNTQRIILPDGSYLDSCITFKYLGDIVSYNLRDNKAICERIKKASQAMGRCRCLFKCDHVELYSKYLFFKR